jgi:hypothetical protein
MCAQDQDLLLKAHSDSKATEMGLKLGKLFFFRGPLSYYLGRVVAVSNSTLFLAEAVRVRNTGMFDNFPQEEIVRVDLETLYDWTPWNPDVPYRKEEE